jgi:hypothetical protein
MTRKPRRRKTITVAGVTFGADEVDSVVVRRDGRLIEITDDDRKRTTIGFAHYATEECECETAEPQEPAEPDEE